MMQLWHPKNAVKVTQVFLKCALQPYVHFVTWDGATLKFDSSNLIAEKENLCC